MLLSENILIVLLFVFHSSRTPASTTGPKREASKNSFQDRKQSFGTLTETHPQVHGECGQSPRGCSARAVRSLRHHEASPHPAQRWNHPQSYPNSTCHGRSHSVKPQLMGLSSPATAEGQLRGSPGSRRQSGELHRSAWRLQAEGPARGARVGMRLAKEHILSRWDSTLSRPLIRDHIIGLRMTSKHALLLSRQLSISESLPQTQINLNDNFLKFWTNLTP